MGLLDKLLGRKSAASLASAGGTASRSANRSNPIVATIDVAPVTPARTALPTVSYQSAIEALLVPPPPNRGREPEALPDSPPVASLEACSSFGEELVAGVKMHPLIAAVHLAFADHRPLVLSPDMMWLLVAQGFANHVNVHAEQLRSRLVHHSGKLTIEVRRDDFIKSSPANPWPELFDEFSARIREHIGDGLHDFLLPVFSTTGAAEKAASQLVLLDSLQSFFSYQATTICGIPQIMLEGSVEDWTLLMERTQSLSRFGLSWWINPLLPILQGFIAAARGQVNSSFWRSIYKSDGGSGGPYATGWITAFFPYLTNYETRRATDGNPWLVEGGDALKEMLYPKVEIDKSSYGHGPTTDKFPNGLASAPLLWNYYGTYFNMEFLGGFVGVRQDPTTFRLRPEIGWAIGESLG